MQKECRHHRHRLFSSIVNKSLSQQQLGSIVRIIFFVSLIPLILIAFYNYPADDDFGFSLPAATAWVTTHSLLSVLQAVVDKTVLTYTTWQGNFASTFLFCVSPMIFNIHLYFISNWCLLALLCLSVGYLLKGISKVYLSLSRSAFWIFYFSVMVLMLQFMPHISDSVFWYNGGQYTAAVCTLIFIFGLLLRCMKKQNTSRSIFRGLALAFLGLMMGGSFYGPALGALVSLTLIMVFSFIHKSENRWYSAITLLFFCIAFIISIVAPGVSLRQEHTGETVGVVRSIIKSVLDSFDLTGNGYRQNFLPC